MQGDLDVEVFQVIGFLLLLLLVLLAYPLAVKGVVLLHGIWLHWLLKHLEVLLGLLWTVLLLHALRLAKLLLLIQLLLLLLVPDLLLLLLVKLCGLLALR